MILSQLPPPANLSPRPFICEILETPAGPVPRIHTRTTARDHWGTVLARSGIRRKGYRVEPGLYAVGKPHDQSEVLVTSNYKLTFDRVRRALDGLDLWLLVLETQGINVWCAAGKGTFGTVELISRIHETGLARQVSHRRIILPQLGATGVNAHQVKTDSGFRVVYGPIDCRQIPAFLAQGRKAAPEMRHLSFNVWDRLILIPVELRISLKPALMGGLAALLLSGIGPGIFSLSAAMERGPKAVTALILGILSGAALVPALLPLIRVKSFALKGLICGLVLGLIPTLLGKGSAPLETSALVLFTMVISSFLAMNFTGATPFTAPSGVEKEMKQYMPVQLAGLVLAAGLWIYTGVCP